jgi:hypothetical protein
MDRMNPGHNWKDSRWREKNGNWESEDVSNVKKTIDAYSIEQARHILNECKSLKVLILFLFYIIIGTCLIY